VEAEISRSTYTATFVAARNTDGLRSFRRLLKFAGRQLGLRAIDVREERVIARASRRPVAPAAGEIPKVRRKGKTTMPSAAKFLGKTFLKLGDVKVNGPIRLFTFKATEGQYGKIDLEFDDHTVLSLNVTNTRAMYRAYGDDYGKWGGKEVELVVGEIEFEGKPTESIILKPISPPIEKKPPKPRKDSGSDMDDEVRF
jgi:hypothetical protein